MVRPKKKWGQNFLRNRGAVDKIVEALWSADALAGAADEVLLEIGPGEGVLTEKLLALGPPVIAIEIDPELAAHLRARFGDRVEIREEDALEAELPRQPFRAVGNLPYNVGTPILRRVIADPHLRRAVFMLQKEVADRIVAKPGTEAYGFLTLFVQLFARAKIVMTLEPRSFYPPPKVRSAVVQLDPADPQLESDRGELLDLISASFRMRRKTLVNNLTGWRGLTREQAIGAVVAAGLGEAVRAETMALHDFDRLANRVASGD